jgi:uncharacterized protein
MPDTALITGASGGIGEELARLLAAGGANVVLVARGADRLASLAGELSRAHRVTASVIPQDLSAPDAVEAIARELAARRLTIDILVNNAGFGVYGPFAETPAAEEARMIQVNVAALTMLTKRLLPGMIERRHGRVLNVASTAAFQPLPGFATYAASKAFVHSFSEAIHSELTGSGVSVTSLCPGFTKTEFDQAAGAEDQAQKLPGFTWMESEDVARQAVEGMIAGKRSVVPGMINKVTSTSGRFLPRTVLLPLVDRVSKSG